MIVLLFSKSGGDSLVEKLLWNEIRELEPGPAMGTLAAGCKNEITNVVEFYRSTANRPILACSDEQYGVIPFVPFIPDPAERQS